MNSRIHSIDILRGLTIFLMIFVNNIGSTVGTPQWLKHMPKEISGMTFVDVIFPAFLIIMGMSIPTATERMIAKGVKTSQIAWSIVLRSASLIYLGLMKINGQRAAIDGWPDGLYLSLSYLAVFAVWFHSPHSSPKAIRNGRIIRACGAVTLAALYFLFDSENTGNSWTIPWWGILGILGWAYFAAASLYLVIRSRMVPLTAVTLLLFGAVFALKGGFFEGIWILQKTTLMDGRPFLAMVGVLIGTQLLPQQNRTPRQIISWCGIVALLCFIGGYLTAPIYGIHKIGASPAWLLYSAAWTIICWAICYWLADIKQKTNTGFTWFASLGGTPLLAYLLSYWILQIFTLIGFMDIWNSWAKINFTAGCLKTLIYTIACSLIGTLLLKKKFRLKL